MEKKFGAVIAGACMVLSLNAAFAATPATPATAPAAKAGPADAQFKTIYTQEWTWRLGQKMEEGEDDEKGGSTTLPRIDPATQQKRLAYWQDVMKKLDGIKQDKLSAEELINYQVYKAQIGALIDAQKFREYEKPLNADTAFWSNMAGAARNVLTKEKEYQDYIKQLSDVPRYFNDQIVNMRAGMVAGMALNGM